MLVRDNFVLTLVLILTLYKQLHVSCVNTTICMQ